MTAREQELRSTLLVRDTISRLIVARWADGLPRHITICGSYRRQCKQLGDIDIIVPLAEFERTLVELKIVVYMRGLVRCSGFIKIGRTYVQIDVYAYRPKEYAYVLLYFTGSREFNIRMRAIAKKKGYLLNNTGMHRAASPEKQLPAANELDIFNRLGMDYVRAENRA